MSTNLDIDFPFKIIRTNRRKTVSIKVLDDQVQINVPWQTSDVRALEFIQKHRAWIRKKLRFNAEYGSIKPKEYVSGENFGFLGKNYRLKIMPAGPGKIQLQNGYLQLGFKQEQSETQRSEHIRRRLMSWYKQQAEKHLLEKTDRYARIIGVKPGTVSVREYKARWGSCSPDNEIRYNWRIIMAPHPVIDYVVVHELCHIIEPNHSPAFWRYVENILSDFRERKAWLKMNGPRLIV